VVNVACCPNWKKKEGEKYISKWRTGLYGDLEGEKERVGERNEDDENVRAVAVEHSKPGSRDQWAGYHLGLFPKKTTLLIFSGRDLISACVPPPRATAGSTTLARNQRQAHLVITELLALFLIETTQPGNNLILMMALCQPGGPELGAQPRGVALRTLRC